MKRYGEGCISVSQLCVIHDYRIVGVYFYTSIILARCNLNPGTSHIRVDEHITPGWEYITGKERGDRATNSCMAAILRCDC